LGAARFQPTRPFLPPRLADDVNHATNLPPDELARMIVQAAEQADQQGYWHGEGAVTEDAARHLTHFLGLLMAGDDDLHRRELDVYGRVFHAAGKGEHSHDDLRTAAMESMEMANDPDALHAFLTDTPAYLRAILEMDRERGTHNADQVVTALSGLGLAILTADGRETVEEDSLFTTHLNHLRGELDVYGVALPT
ncbi:MAG: hypothetical protein AVDCRST_MAG89-3377, partial [uncultured Gemmatimonadetes bacterium]